MGCKKPRSATSAPGKPGNPPTTLYGNQVEDTEKQFAVICKRLTVLIRAEESKSEIIQDGKSFKAKHDTMVYTVHGRGMGPDFSPKTRQETGPRFRGFVIDVSINPGSPGGAVAAASGGTWHGPYWQEYLWHGHSDGKQYIRFVFKYGSGVENDFRQRTINAVIKPVQ
jgi:hypothetical protein